MRYVKRILIVFLIASVGYLVVNEYVGPFVNNEKTQTGGVAVKAESIYNGIVVYYFHGNRRCPTCNAIERYSFEAVMPYINVGILTWKTVNVETQDNGHFINDFGLASSGPVIVEYNDGNIARWKALDGVWQLVRDKDTLKDYVKAETKRFIQ